MSLSSTDSDKHALSLSSDLGIDDASTVDQVPKEKLKHQNRSPQKSSSDKFKRIKHEHHPRPYEFKSKCQSNNYHKITGHDSRPSANLPPNLGITTPQEGSIYSSFKALRHAIDAWALRENFIPRIYKKDSIRVIYICCQASHGCEWRVRANTCGKHNSAVLVSIVQPHHSCKSETCQHDRTVGCETTRSKHAKRGVQFTQRWVRDALVHCGFVVSPETDPMTIVRCIENHLGEIISENLALKAKNSLLVARGELLPQRTKKPGRPTRAEIEERKRDMQHAMALQLHEHRAGRTSPDRCLHTVHDLGQKIDEADGFSDLPDDYKTMYHVPDTINGFHQYPEKTDSSDYAIDPRLSGVTSTTIPSISTEAAAHWISVSYTPSASSDSATATDKQRTCSLSSPGALPCEACNGTGVSKLYSASLRNRDSDLAIDEPSSCHNIDREILLLQNQMLKLQNQIEALKWQQQRVHDAAM